MSADAVKAEGFSIDPHSATWHRVEKWIEIRLWINRARLETASVPMDETENARGAIEELNALKELGSPPAGAASGFVIDESDN